MKRIFSTAKRLARRVLSRFDLVKGSSASEFWDREGGSWELGKGIHWTEHLAVQERFNLKIGGHIHHDLFLFLTGFLRNQGFELPLERALTLGCGTGEFERKLAGYEICRSHEGFDLSPESIRAASEKASEEGLDGLSYEVRDIDRISLSPARYDLVFGIQSVHHFSRLEHVFTEVYQALKPGGFFILHEFVGPSRFQWTDRQLEAVNGVLKLLPERYRRNLKAGGNELISHVSRPAVKEMIRTDPSEAARSSEILEVLPEYFRIIEARELGGALIQLVMEGITGNFDYDSPEDMKLLKLIFQLEDILMDMGELSSDFIFVIAGKK